MEIESVPAASLVSGDVVSFDLKPGWWTVGAVTADRSGIIHLTLANIAGDESGVWRFGPNDVLRRTDPASVHDKDEFIGMTIAEARAWAGALGWVFRDHSEGGFRTDDLRRDRINVWADQTGVVVRTEMY